MKKEYFLAALIFYFISSIQVIAAQQEKHALVIGNSKYSDSPLKNPVNDAVDMSTKLRQRGFAVTTLLDADKRKMKTAINSFTRKLKKGSVGLFFFAGHGVEVNGNNYLVPISANILSEADVEFEAVNAARVLANMGNAANSLNLVILDACRNNPYARGFRSASRGLAKMTAPTGSMLMYATKPGDVAADGSGRNGLFTEKLLQSLDVKGLKVEEVFKQTALAVSKASGKKQVPYIEGVILGDFYFLPSVKQLKVNIVAPSQSSVVSNQAEIVFWQSVEKQDDKEGYQAYIEQWPDGQFVALANMRLKKLKKSFAGNIKGPNATKYTDSFFQGKRISGETPRGAEVSIKINTGHEARVEVEGLSGGFRENGKWYVDQDYFICMRFSRFGGGRLICRYPQEKDGKILLFARDGDPDKPVWKLH